MHNKWEIRRLKLFDLFQINLSINKGSDETTCLQLVILVSGLELNKYLLKHSERSEQSVSRSGVQKPHDGPLLDCRGKAPVGVQELLEHMAFQVLRDKNTILAYFVL